MEYKVVMSGALRAGVDPATARRNIASVFGIADDHKLDMFFTGKDLVVKKNLDRVKAGRYLAAIRQAGFECQVIPPLETAATPLATAEQKPAQAPALVTEKTGLSLVPIERDETPEPAPPEPVEAVVSRARPGQSADTQMRPPVTPSLASPDFPAQQSRSWIGTAWFPFACILLLVIWLAQSWGGGAFAKTDQQYGEKVAFTLAVPAEVIAKYNALPAHKKNPNMSALENALAADSVDWSDTVERSFSRADSPYTVVVKMKGRAIADGNAMSLTSIGYGDENGIKSSMLTIGKVDGKAGEVFEAIKTPAVTRFREDGKRFMHLSLANRSNLQVDQIDLEVWSGKTSFQMHWALYWLLGLVALRIAFRFVLRDL